MHYLPKKEQTSNSCQRHTWQHQSFIPNINVLVPKSRSDEGTCPGGAVAPRGHAVTHLCCSQHLFCEDCWGRKNTETPLCPRWGKECSGWRFPSRWAGNQAANKEREKPFHGITLENDSLGENRAALSHLHTNSAERKNKHEPRGQEGKQIRKYGSGGGGIGVEEQKGLSAYAFLLDPSKEPLQTRDANQEVPWWGTLWSYSHIAGAMVRDIMVPRSPCRCPGRTIVAPSSP